MLVLKGLVGLHKTVKFSFFSITGCGIGLDYCDIEWFALEMNRDHSVVFEIASKYCIGTQMLGPRIMVSDVIKQEMARVNVNILGISELKSMGMGELNSDNHYIHYCGQEFLRSGEPL